MALAEAEAAHLYKVTRMFEPRLPGFGPNPAQGGPAPDLETPQGRQVAVEKLRATIAHPNADVVMTQELDALLQERDGLGEYKVSDGAARLLVKDLIEGQPVTLHKTIAMKVERAIEERRRREAEMAAFREIAAEKAAEDQQKALDAFIRESVPIYDRPGYPFLNFVP
jgi:hypothetical protein